MSRRRSQIAQPTLDFPVTKNVRVTRSKSLRVTRSTLQSETDCDSPVNQLIRNVRASRNKSKDVSINSETPDKPIKKSSSTAKKNKIVHSPTKLEKPVSSTISPAKESVTKSPPKNVLQSPRKRNNAKIVLQSPGKRGNMENICSSTSKKMKMKFDSVDNNLYSPSKTGGNRIPFSPVRDPQVQTGKSPLSNSGRMSDLASLKQIQSPHKIYTDRLPLSPARNRQVLSPLCSKRASPKPKCAARLDMNSPVKENFPTPAEQGNKTPIRGVRALNFSHLSFNDATPNPDMTSLKVRSLNFSPQKDGSVLCTSPRKEVLSSQSLMSPLRLARQEGVSYQRAKQALHTAQPDRVLCREKEMNEVLGFLEGHLDKSMAGSMYISGAPGTGKTAVLSTVREEIEMRSDCEVVYLNCMSLKSSMAIYNAILIQMTGRPAGAGISAATKKLEQLLTGKGKSIVLILDEVDSLDSKNQEVLYTMFEWPALNKSRAVLIGIANSLDLTDRILPRLQARPKCKPQLLHFPPYTPAQITTVLKERLAKVQVDGQCVLEPSAIQFCARKVASVAGDMRKALDICRRAVEMVQADVRKQRVLQASRCNSPIKTPRSPMKTTRSPSKCLRSPVKGFVSPTKVLRSPVKALSSPIKMLKSPRKGLKSPCKVPRSPSKPGISVPKKITVAHIHKIVNEVYGTGASQNTAQQESLPVQQKIAVCTLLLVMKKAKLKQVTLGKFHEAYGKVCRRQEMPAIDQSEFLALCSLLESRGMMAVKKAKDTRNSKISLKLDEREVEHAMQDKRLMTQILNNGL